MRRSVALLVMLFALAAGLTAQEPAPPLFLQADRQLDGNRLITAPLPLASMQATRVPLGQPIVRAAGYVLRGEPEWVVQLADASFLRVRIENDRPVWNPIVRADADSETSRSGPSQNPLTLAWNGEIGRWLPVSPGEFPRFYLPQEGDAPLPDGHVAAGPGQLVAYLSSPTDEYAHGVLGDAIEAGSITILSNAPPRTIELAPQVAEERGVLLRDLDQDGTPEIVTVLADALEGAFLAAFSTDGRMVARGDAVGRGFRWRHLIGAGPLGPNGEELTAAVVTPHIGGSIEYHDESLSVLARLPGYSSHAYGSPGLGDAWIVNLDSDARWEILLPTQRRTRLEAVTLSRQGPRTLWRYELDARLSSNLAIADPATDHLPPAGAATGRGAGLLLGTSDGMMHLWWE